MEQGVQRSSCCRRSTSSRRSRGPPAAGRLRRRRPSYGDDPVAVARAFADAGARWLHVVDLDGARAGEPRQLGLAAVDRRRGPRPGAGRDRRRPADRRGGRGCARDGAAGPSSGPPLLRDPAFAASLVARHGPDRIVASIDVRDGMALGEGWREGAPGLPAARRSRGSPRPASRPSRSRPSSVTACSRARTSHSSAPARRARPRPDHRVGRRLVGRRRHRRPGRRLRRRDRRSRALRGPHRPARTAGHARRRRPALRRAGHVAASRMGDPGNRRTRRTSGRRRPFRSLKARAQ